MTLPRVGEASIKRDRNSLSGMGFGSRLQLLPEKLPSTHRPQRVRRTWADSWFQGVEQTRQCSWQWHRIHKITIHHVLLWVNLITEAGLDALTVNVRYLRSLILSQLCAQALSKDTSGAEHVPKVRCLRSTAAEVDLRQFLESSCRASARSESWNDIASGGIVTVGVRALPMLCETTT